MRPAAVGVAGAALLAAAVAAGAGALAAGGSAGGGGGGGTARPQVREVMLVARHSRFSPARVSVPAGTTVRFVVRNADPINHELIIGDAATHRRHRAGQEAHHRGDVPGEISVAAGRTAVTTVRFDRPGTVVFACHLPGHLDYGMAGMVLVTA